MTLTRCPACQTVFRVRPDQLAVRGGQVRCGHCFDAFNAREHLVEESAAAVAPAAPSAPPGQPASDAQPPHTTRDEPFFVLEERSGEPLESKLDFEIPDTLVLRGGHEARMGLTPGTAAARIEPWGTPLADSLDFVPPPPPRPQAAPQPNEDSAPAAPAAAVEPADYVTAPDILAEERYAPDEPIEATPTASLDRDEQPAPATEQDWGATEPVATFTAGEPEQTVPALEADHEALDRDYGRLPPERKPRPFAGLLAGLLLGTLAAQSVYLFRGEIARDWPALRPALVTACGPLNCEVPLPQVASALSVEASDLQVEPAPAGRYTLHATVRNRAPHPQAFPHLELTLLDGREQVLARKVFAPQEWAADADRNEGFAAMREMAVVLPIEVINLEPAGYRIYVFYP